MLPVAVMVAVPTVWAVARPLASMDATLVFELDQVTKLVTFVVEASV